MKRIVVSSAVLALAIAGVSQATAAPAEFRVTGGGQIIADTTAPTAGPGQTIAFTAQSAPTAAQADAARGQLQFNDHAGNKFHGVVTCLSASPTVDGDGTAVIGGFLRDEPSRVFRIDVVDNGEGNADDDDLISLRRDGAARDGGDSNTDTELCDAEDEPADMQLGRGNVQVHKAKS